MHASIAAARVRRAVSRQHRLTRRCHGWVAPPRNPCGVYHSPTPAAAPTPSLAGARAARATPRVARLFPAFAALGAPHVRHRRFVGRATVPHSVLDELVHTNSHCINRNGSHEPFRFIQCEFTRQKNACGRLAARRSAGSSEVSGGRPVSMRPRCRDRFAQSVCVPLLR